MTLYYLFGLLLLMQVVFYTLEFKAEKQRRQEVQELRAEIEDLRYPETIYVEGFDL